MAIIFLPEADREGGKNPRIIQKSLVRKTLVTECVKACLRSLKWQANAAEIGVIFKFSADNIIIVDTAQRSKKWLVRGLVKFATAVARLVCLDLLG